MASDPPALVNARRAFAAGRIDEARSLVQGYLKRDPSHAEANHSLAVILMHSKDRERALYHAQRAAHANVADYQFTLAMILGDLDRGDEARKAARRAIELSASNADGLLRLTPWLWEHGDHEGALAAAQAAMKLDPSRARSTYAGVLANIGRLDDGVDVLRTELKREPGASDALVTLATLLNYQFGANAHEVFEIHRRYGASIEDASPRASTVRRTNDGRKLRVAFISPDLYSHSVAFFLEPILKYLNRAAFEVWCFSSRAVPDAMTARLKALAEGWRDIAGWSDDAIAAQIASDEIDILVDLVGLTTGRVTTILAMRAAPVQVTMIGYPNTTGLSSVGYRVVDSITDPPGSDTLATERLVRLPRCFLCYQPLQDAPEPGPRPDGRTVFGSFNTAQKIVGEVIRTWADIVNAVPGSRLVLKAAQFSCPMVRADFAKRFVDAGLDAARLELLPPVRQKAGHLAAYDRIDIGLDPFPYNGTTTTCEAMWMGVPVVTLRGCVHAGRVGASLLTAIGATELIASDEREYKHIAVSLAHDHARRLAYAQSLRARMRDSSLCDGPDYGRALGQALHDMWAQLA